MESTLAQKIRRSLDVSWKEGIPAAVMLGVTEYYVVPYGLFLGATIRQIGLLVALPQLAASCATLFADEALRLIGTRLALIVRMTSFQAALLLPVAFLALAPDLPGRTVLLILLMVAFRVVANLIGPAWGSLMSDYLPAQKRGRYFGARSRVVGAAQVAGMGAAGGVLFLTKATSPSAGFCLIFLGAAIARAFSTTLLSRMADLPLHSSPGSHFTFLMFLRRFRESNFVKFTLFASGILFATHLAAPFFSVYMLRDLKWNYLQYMMVHLAGVIAGILILPVWGRHADIVGNARVLKATGLMVPFIPIFWLFSRHPAALFVVELFSGFAWGGFNLCATNFIYDSVTPEKRVRCIGYFNLINGIAIFAGTSLGGLLAERLPPLLGFRILTLFLLSAGARLAVYGLLSPNFQEVREQKSRVSSVQLFFSVIGIRPLAGLGQEE